MSKRVLIIGGGGREHALCWKLAQSHQVETIYCAPGNAGTNQTQKTRNVDIAVSDFTALIRFAQEQQVDLTVVGPDKPLADGIVDQFQAAGLQVFGPTQSAARLESSKVFSKQFMKTYGLPTARFEIFESAEAALDFCNAHDWARVIKVDGLALGKGVFVCDTLADCDNALQAIFESKRFGTAGTRVIVEERLVGPEISLMVLCDGNTLLPFESSQDYKRRFDNQLGPNTGGMGAYSPVPIYADYQDKVLKQVILPLQKALDDAPFVFQGLLFIGLMIHEHELYILEFNARFGDPETQSLLPRLNNDLYSLFEASIDGTLHEQTLSWRDEASVCVVLTAKSYPETGSQNIPITISPLPADVLLFHAGTRLTPEQQLVTNGGRVLNVTALSHTPEAAAHLAYQTIDQIHCEALDYRRDIAKDVSLCRSR
jgi:phosphoribosylamine---glycine ligase